MIKMLRSLRLQFSVRRWVLRGELNGWQVVEGGRVRFFCGLVTGVENKYRMGKLLILWGIGVEWRGTDFRKKGWVVDIVRHVHI